jgi:hypothetical protein
MPNLERNFFIVPIVIVKFFSDNNEEGCHRSEEGVSHIFPIIYFDIVSIFIQIVVAVNPIIIK